MVNSTSDSASGSEVGVVVSEGESLGASAEGELVGGAAGVQAVKSRRIGKASMAVRVRM
jgi:hypothetical protein